MKKEFGLTLKIAFPLILSNVTQIALGLIDTAMVGSIDYMQLAAAALVTNVIAIPQIAAIGLTTAMTPLVAIANGQDNTFSASRFLYNGVFVCLVTGIIIAISLELNPDILYHLGQDEKVVAIAIPYFKVMAWSLIPMTFFLSMKQFCDALEYTKVAMTFSLLSIPLNVSLNWVLIFGHFGLPRLELLGAGIGTIMTRILMALGLLYYIYHAPRFKKYLDIKKEAWKFKMDVISQFLRLGIPTSFQFGIEVAAFAISGIIIGWFGPVQQASHQIAINICTFTFMIIVGISTAGSIRVSNALGRNQLKELQTIGKSTFLLGASFGIGFAILYIIFHKYIPYIFNQQKEIIELAATLLLFASVFQLSDATQSMGSGLLRGIKDVQLPTLFVGFAYWVIGLPLGYYLGVVLDMKAYGIWIGFVFGLTTSSILLNLRFKSLVEKMIRKAKL
ncbi:MAG: MATE family efflux transporter [Chitinophagales bacterium]|nr:MATE family efflux transporter [Chitinophagales bacterium]